MKLLKREEILKLAQQAKLMYVDGDACYLNDMATDKEVVSLVRLIEAALKHSATQPEAAESPLRLTAGPALRQFPAPSC